MSDSTTRFSNRVENYVKYRPGYPEEIIDYLQSDFNLSPNKLIADIGAGTGISATLFLKGGYAVKGVEPNEAMREKAVELLSGYDKFTAINGTAEHTTLSENSIDVIVCGQAFHWFNNDAAKAEFKRILKQDGVVVLIWNERLATYDFERDYDKLITRNGKDYVSVDHRNIDTESIENFFETGIVRLKSFANKQVFDFDGLKGRLLSSSYMPAENEAGYDKMLSELKDLFQQYQQDNLIQINYETKVYVCRF